MTFNEFINYFGEQIRELYEFEKTEPKNFWIWDIDWTDYEIHCYLRFRDDRSMFERHNRYYQKKISVNGTPLAEYLAYN